ncbi:MAG: hypothetical protein ABIG95_05950 [Candidatus Woesearchaeota archaeon]
MSQIEQNIRLFLSKNPEIEKCIQNNLINRRSLARYLIQKGVARQNEFEAVIATLRRYDFKEYKQEVFEIFHNTKLRVKDNIIILDYEKDKRLLQELKKIIDVADYDKGDTLKIVVGDSLIKLFLDEEKLQLVENLTKSFRLQATYKKISEISITFPRETVNIKGIISFITRELYVNDILICELLTASPELLIYVQEEYVLRAYEVIKQLQKTF